MHAHEHSQCWLDMHGIASAPAAWPCRRLRLERGRPTYVMTTASSALQATQEKVAALMQAADAKGNRRTSAGGGKGSSASPAKTAAQGGGWRVSTVQFLSCAADMKHVPHDVHL